MSQFGMKKYLENQRSTNFRQAQKLKKNDIMKMNQMRSE